MKKIRAAVVGVGYLGKFHAEKYASLPHVELVGVADSDRQRAEEIAASLGTRAFDDYRELAGLVDAVSVVVPTSMHYDVGSFFLQNGINLLLEKPITSTITEAQKLIELAAARNLVLQVGHLERFNPALDAVRGTIRRPGFIDAVRVAPYKPRGTDVSVVLDLMVHDIDLINTLIGSAVKNISAAGAMVYSATPDIANARIEFENGATANLTASRISPQGARKMQIFQEDAYLTVDFQNRKSAIYRTGKGELSPGVPLVQVDEVEVPQRDQILAEIEAFVLSVAEGSPVAVSGADGLRALDIALQIEAKISENLETLKVSAC
jgi:predicted dehydrogenase